MPAPETDLVPARTRVERLVRDVQLFHAERTAVNFVTVVSHEVQTVGKADRESQSVF